MDSHENLCLSKPFKVIFSSSFLISPLIGRSRHSRTICTTGFVASVRVLFSNRQWWTCCDGKDNFKGLKKNSMTSWISTFPTVFTALNTARVLILFSFMLFNTFVHYRMAGTMLSSFQMNQYSFNLHKTILWFTPFYRWWNSGNESKPHTPSLCS